MANDSLHNELVSNCLLMVLINLILVSLFVNYIAFEVQNYLI